MTTEKEYTSPIHDALPTGIGANDNSLPHVLGTVHLRETVVLHPVLLIR